MLTAQDQNQAQPRATVKSIVWGRRLRFSNAYQGGIRYGGALELKQVTWAFRHALRSRAAAADPVAKAALEATDLRDWMDRLPWAEGQSPLTPVPDYERFLFEQWTNGTFDDYWKVPAFTRQVGTIPCAACPACISRGGTTPTR